jgi:hypothetical protein
VGQGGVAVGQVVAAQVVRRLGVTHNFQQLDVALKRE